MLYRPLNSITLVNAIHWHLRVKLLVNNYSLWNSNRNVVNLVRFWWMLHTVCTGWTVSRDQDMRVSDVYRVCCVERSRHESVWCVQGVLCREIKTRECLMCTGWTVSDVYRVTCVWCVQGVLCREIKIWECVWCVQGDLCREIKDMREKIECLLAQKRRLERAFRACKMALLIVTDNLNCRESSESVDLTQDVVELNLLKVDI